MRRWSLIIPRWRILWKFHRPVGAGQLPHDHVIVAEWNNRRHVERIFAEHATGDFGNHLRTFIG